MLGLRERWTRLEWSPRVEVPGTSPGSGPRSGPLAQEKPGWPRPPCVGPIPAHQRTPTASAPRQETLRTTRSRQRDAAVSTSRFEAPTGRLHSEEEMEQQPALARQSELPVRPAPLVSRASSTGPPRAADRQSCSRSAAAAPKAAHRRALGLLLALPSTPSSARTAPPASGGQSLDAMREKTAKSSVLRRFCAQEPFTPR